MAIKFESVKEGDVLWDVHPAKMGSTRMSKLTSWPVKVVSIDHEAEEAMASWNGNRPRPYSRRQIERLRRSPHKEQKRT